MSIESESASNPGLSAGEQWIQEPSTARERTRQGLKFIIFGSILVCLAAYGVLYLRFGETMLGVVMQILPVTALMGNLIILAGTLLFFLTPEEVNSRGVLIGAAVCMLAKVVYAAAVFWGPGILGVALTLGLKLAGKIGLVLIAWFLRSLVIYLKRSDQLMKVHALLVISVLCLLGSWIMEVAVDRGELKETMLEIYSVTLIGLLLYPFFLLSIKKVLYP